MPDDPNSNGTAVKDATAAPRDAEIGTAAEPMSPEDRDNAIYDMLVAGETDLDAFVASREPKAPDPATASETPAKDTPSASEPAREADTAPPSGEPGAVTSRDQALSILRRDGWQDEDLEGLPEETLIRRAAHRQKVQRDGDALGSEHASLKDRLTRLEGFMEGRGAPEGDPAPEASADPALSDLSEKVKAEFGDEIADRLNGILTETRSELRELQQVRQSEQMRAARSMLGDGDFPEIRDEAAYKRVVNVMVKLAGTGDYGRDDVGELMKHAALLEFGTDIRAAATKRMMDAHSAAENGQPEPPDNDQTDPTPASGMSKDEAESLVYDLMAREGLSPHEARSKVRTQVMR